MKYILAIVKAKTSIPVVEVCDQMHYQSDPIIKSCCNTLLYDQMKHTSSRMDSYERK